MLYLLLCKRCGPVTAASATVLAFAAMRFRFLVRPHILSLFLFVLLLPLCEKLPENWKRRIFLLFPLFALWSNIHPEFLFGLAYLGAVTIAEMLEGGTVGIKRAAGPAMTLALCTVATLANPGLSHSLLLPLKVLGLEEVVSISEYYVSSPGRVPFFWIATGLAAASFARAEPGKRIGRVPVFLLFTLFGLVFLRAAAYSLVVSSLVLCRNLSEGEGLRRRYAAGGLLAAAALGAFVYAMHFDRNLPYRWGTGVREIAFPVAAVDFMERSDLPGNLYNHYVFGGYLMHRLYPRYGVFQDSRFFPYPPDFLARSHGRFDHEDWKRLLEKHGVRTALAFARDVGRLFDLEEWSVVYWDDRFAVLLRRGAAPSSSHLAYRYFYPGSGAPVSREQGYLEGLLQEMTRNQGERLRPSAAIERERGEVLRLLGREEESRRAFDRASTLEGLPGVR
jgi:hypothetical protein